MSPKFTWDDELDLMKSAGEIANALFLAGITGNGDFCPLEIATGWKVTTARRYLKLPSVRLTPAEMQFIEGYDNNLYPGLVGKED